MSHPTASELCQLLLAACFSLEITPNFPNNTRDIRTEHKPWVRKVSFMKTKDAWILSTLVAICCFPVHVKGGDQGSSTHIFEAAVQQSSNWCKLHDLLSTFEVWQDKIRKRSFRSRQMKYIACNCTECKVALKGSMSCYFNPFSKKKKR